MRDGGRGWEVAVGDQKTANRQLPAPTPTKERTMEQALVVPGAGEARWTVDLAAAGQVARWARNRAQLAWLGHLPLPVQGLPRALKRIRAHPHPRYPLVPIGSSLLWLAPVLAF